VFYLIWKDKLLNTFPGELIVAVNQSFTLRNLSALLTTDTELKLMAAAAIIGLNNMPKKG